MSQRLVRRRISGPSASAAAGAVLALAWAIAVFGQGGRPDAGGPYPRLPGAVTSPPDWLGRDAGAPFDLARYFAAPPRASNAAPLYLDALFEFGVGMASCFPEGPERERRRLAVSEALKRHAAVWEAFYKDPRSVPAPKLDEIIKLYDTGFRKLAEAQRRERCVFETDIGIFATLPHVDAARQVSRVASIRVQRAVERRDFDAAIRDVETVLRLTRDLQPRGPMMSQLVVSAVTQVVCFDIIMGRILPAPGLRDAHCDRLLAVLAGHDAKATDGYAELVRGEYLSSRRLLHRLVHDQAELDRQLKTRPGELVKTILRSPPGPGAPPRSTRPVPDDADARVARAKPADLARVVPEIDAYHRAILGLDGIPYAARLARIEGLERSPATDDLLSQLVAEIEAQPDTLATDVRGIARGTTVLRGTEGLLALRRWQLTHRAPPRDLAAAVKGTALKGVPVDPYDGKPMRMVLLDNQPAVYCIGRDGRDDGGQKDSDRDIKPAGDWIFRLPAPQARR